MRNSKFPTGNSEAHSPLVSVQFADAAVCAGCALHQIFSWPHVPACYIVWKLEKYDGTDLTKLPDAEKQRVDHWIASLTGQKLDEPLAAFTGP